MRKIVIGWSLGLLLLACAAPLPRRAAAQTCGNGVLDPGETCDPPGSPAGQNGAKCRADCTYCGDGIKNGGKYCSDPFFVYIACTTDSDCEDIGTCVSETCDPGNDPKCLPDCSGRIHNDPAIIRYGVGENGSDLLYVHGAIQNDRLIPVDQETVGVRLINRNTGAVVYEATVPVGAGTSVRKTKPRIFYRFANPSAKSSSSGGISMFKVSKDARWYRVNAWAWGNLQGAVPEMTVELDFGSERWTSQGKFHQTLNGQTVTGWYMFLK